MSKEVDPLRPPAGLASARAIAMGGVLPVAMAAGWATLFGYLSVIRDAAGGSHAEDLGFTEQVLWNFLHGQWFRMSIYSGATWNTEIDVSRIARPDSLLAFHVEPMLLALVPLYALAGTSGLLILQAAAIAAGALPAFRIATHLAGSLTCGVAVAAAYLLSPLGQWAVLADFHTSTLAAPLLLLSMERLLVARSPAQAIIAAALATAAREDAAPVVAVLGLTLMLNSHTRRTGLAVASMGLAWSLLSLAIIRTYSGGISPFEVRYGPTLGDLLTTLSRPAVASYAATLLLSGGWLGLLAPLALLPALPSVALNILSTSPWMAAGKAHYSGLVLPFVTLAAAAALGRLRTRRKLRTSASAALVLSSVFAYLQAGAGPLAANYAPVSVTSHATLAANIAADLPGDAAVSASASLVPRISDRSHVYVFPAVLDAGYIFLDLRASPAPTSALDVYLRTQALLADGWQIRQSADGLLLLAHVTDTVATAPATTAAPVAEAVSVTPPRLLSATLLPSPDGGIDVDGPTWILRTTWQTEQPLPSNARPDFWIDLQTGEQLHLWDIADVWWNPPDHWPVGQPMTLDVPNVPVRAFSSWSATWSVR